MTQSTKTNNRSDRESGATQTLESLAEQKATHNQSAKRTTAGDLVPSYRGTRYAHIGID